MSLDRVDDFVEPPRDKHDFDLEYLAPNPRQILRISMNLKYLIDKIIPIEYPISEILAPKSRILNGKVIRQTYEAAGGVGNGKHGTSSQKYRAALVFCLLKTCEWYWELRTNELSDYELYTARAFAAQQLAKIIIENERDERYLFISMLCQRYSINSNNKDLPPKNALEAAVDMHSTIVISSSGYQRCIKWLWRGYIIQSSSHPSKYIMYNASGNANFSVHFNPDRIKTPFYQNTLEIIFSLIYLFLYTIIINIDTENRILNFFEVSFYILTFGYVFDEIGKLYLVGKNYATFWNVFNDIMYAIVIASIVLRIIALTTDKNSTSIHYDQISFRILSMAAPFVWSRLLLYLDTQQFIGAMLVVIKHMMKESAIFFFLLLFVLVGFLQGFLGLDQADGKRDATSLIFSVLFRTVIGGPNFNAFGEFAFPYTDILYYFFSFMVLVVLLNVLVALYSTAYSNVVSNATDEYLALVAQKTLRYIRSPDENVYVPPLNLIEILFVQLPFQCWMKRSDFRNLNRIVMTILYSPFLFFSALQELKDARRIRYNRAKNYADDANEIDTPWSLTDGFEETEGSDADIQSHDDRINEELRVQKNAEIEDPEFQPNRNKWIREVRKLSQPVAKGFETGIGWECYDIYRKVDELTELVKIVVKENQDLKKKKVAAT
ncbi:hypothetical protein PACTADRAFT_49446 [Pachysolen tannophilus NRRL Y-2460]|uniref:Ion transport domain-containing protein n=1 Tax=Pachysolen tannophilus NRRL Y-2460 TaxID=669874 RepID=A0A1E4TWB5_PACTA|nr:hypothetical protein PACTADRAFT_49446 [Pachysolen tannophilus NRRL Y-2460]